MYIGFSVCNCFLFELTVTTVVTEFGIAIALQTYTHYLKAHLTGTFLMAIETGIRAIILKLMYDFYIIYIAGVYLLW